MENLKIVFVSNYFNHHQKPLSDALDKGTNRNYQFIATEKMDSARYKLGWGEVSIPEYVHETYKQMDKEEENSCMRMIDNANLVIAGSCPEKLIRRRIRSNKLVFRYSERPFKKKNKLLKYLPRYIKWHIHNPTTKPIYILCASAYTALDYAKFGLFKNKAYKWGYFPETKHYDNIHSLIADKKEHSLLWVGRMINWKHPDDAINVARRLKKAGYTFDLNMIGIGDMKDYLYQMIIEYDLTDCVHLLGPMKPWQVREYMERSEVFLFTSDRQEGWGAVLNEAMNSACAVVASHSIGSVPYLIENKKNGLVYKSGDIDMFYTQVRDLFDNSEKQQELAEAAYRTIVEMWNAEVAAERLMALTIRIIAGEKHPDLYTNGPCSKAEIIMDNWLG